MPDTPTLRGFVDRHVGPDQSEIRSMLETVGAESLSDLIDRAVPSIIRSHRLPDVPGPMTETAALQWMRRIADKNEVLQSFIGMGYYGTITPGVIQRNILENPGWYTAYTPYQPEISQGRLEALINFQTAVADLTGLDIANSSLLDEGTAAAEAMTMMKRVLFVSHIFPPMVAGGATRVGRFARYLPEFGWMPTILTGPLVEATAVDAGALEQIPSVVEVVRAHAPFSKIGPRGSPNPTTGLAGLKRRLMRFAMHMTCIPDRQIFWVPYALRAGRRAAAPLARTASRSPRCVRSGFARSASSSVHRTPG